MKKLLYYMLTFFLFFLVIEMLLRLTNDNINLLGLTGKEKVVNPYFWWATNEPFFSYSAKKGVYDEGKTVNTYQFISTPEISIEKPNNTIRIAFLGGSSTAGTSRNLPDTLTWPWQVIELLKNKGYKVDFINAACSGYTSFESYGILWSKLRLFQPDIVLVNHGWNDFSYFHQNKREILNFRKNEKGKYEGVKWKGYFESKKSLLIDRYISWSQLFTRIRLFFYDKEGIGEIIVDEEFDSIDYTNKGLFGRKAFVENIKLIYNYCNTFNIDCFFCLQPNNLDYEEAQTESKRLNHLKENEDLLNEVNAIINSIVPKNKVIDLSTLSNKKELFFDPIHPSAEGTKSIAKIVSDSLLSNYFEKLIFVD